MIVDTSFLVDLFNGDPDAFEHGMALADGPTVQRVPTPALAEVAYGTTFGDLVEEREARNAIRIYPVIGVDVAVARRAGELLADADRAAGGTAGIDWMDALIAGVADVLDEPVLTADTADFRELGVAVETY